MFNLPTLVFIPGAWHKPTCYDKVTKIIREQSKLKCVYVTLPSTTGNPAATFKDDLDAAREAISNEIANGRNVVVLAHSYGGMVGNSCVKGFTRPQDAAASQTQPPTTGYVIGLILMASGFTFTGLSFMDPFFGHPPPSWRVNNETGFADIVIPPQEFFYHDLPADEADYWASQITPQSLKALFEGGEYSHSGWRDLPVWLIGTVEDRGLPVFVQRTQVGMARAMGATVEYRELQTSHSPFLSQPEPTAKIILEAVEAFTGESKGNESTTSEGSQAIVVGRTALWQPSTWFRFGLPMVMGRVIGRCVLVFTWGWRLWKSRCYT